jgi:uncharacterized protein YndB with AHSA1/START domain
MKETAPPKEETTLRLRRVFKAPREAVFAAWTNPEQMKKWVIPEPGFVTPEVEVDLRIGGKYRIQMLSPKGNFHTAVGVYREVSAPEKLVFSWSWLEYPMHGETQVTIEFLERGGETEMLFTHEFFPNKDSRDDHNRGWSGAIGHLQTFVEGKRT